MDTRTGNQAIRLCLDAFYRTTGNAGLTPHFQITASMHYKSRSSVLRSLNSSFSLASRNPNIGVRKFVKTTWNKRTTMKRVVLAGTTGMLVLAPALSHAQPSLTLSLISDARLTHTNT